MLYTRKFQAFHESSDVFDSRPRSHSKANAAPRSHIYVSEYLVINSDIPQNPYLIIQARVLSPGPRNVELHPLGPNTNPEKAKNQQSIASYSTK